MEAYFHKDSRIEEWVDEITEKLFTMCLLTGVDSETEYQRGCEIVMKVTTLLQEIPTFPSEYLEDGLKQLLEQQLPDAQVINNYPTFLDNMNKMLREGMAKAIDNQTDNIIPALAPLNVLKSTIIGADFESNIGAKIEVESEAKVEAKTEDEVAVEINAVDPTPFKKTNLANEAVKDESISIPYGMLRTSQVPEQAGQLKRVLSNIFPNGAVCWNKKLMGQIFLAQVEDILICLQDSEPPCLIENFNKEGWKVFVCRPEDLTFPRRLERGIRQIQRSGKMHIIE